MQQASLDVVWASKMFSDCFHHITEIVVDD